MANVKTKEHVSTELAVASDNLPAEIKKTTEIVTKPGTAHIAIYKPAEVEVYDIEEGEDTGIHGGDEGGQDKRLAIFRILQANSPQAKRGMPQHIPGAKEGDFLNTATNQVYDGEKGLYLIAAHKHLKFPKYIQREDDGSGGGFLGIYEAEHPEVREGQRLRKEQFGNLFGPLPAGTTEDGKQIELVETYYIDSVIVVPNDDGTFPGEFGTAFNGSFAFSSTFIRAYNSWKDRLENMTYIIKRRDGSVGPTLPTLWTHVWHIRSKVRPRGAQSWMVPVLTLGGKNDKGEELAYKHSKLDRNDYLYIQAERLREEILEGHVELAFEKDTTESSSTDTMARGGGANEEIPFGTE